MNILLTLILIVNVGFLALILYAGYKIVRVYREFKQFVSAPDDKTPSPLANVVSTASDMIARSFVAQLKATFMGKQSGENRANAGVEADIAMDTISQINPVIGTVLNSFPALRKTLRRNPGLIDLAISKLAGTQGAKQAILPGSQENHQVEIEQPKFKF